MKLRCVYCIVVYVVCGICRLLGYLPCYVYSAFIPRGKSVQNFAYQISYFSKGFLAQTYEISHRDFQRFLSSDLPPIYVYCKIHLFVYSSICFSFICSFIHLFAFHLSVRLFIYLFFHLSFYSFIHFSFQIFCVEPTICDEYRKNSNLKKYFV